MRYGSKIGRLVGLSLLIITAGCFLGCEGRTGKIGTPITERYHTRLDELEVGKSSPADLQLAFMKENVSKKSDGMENGKHVAVWEVFRGGNMDTGEFLLWGQVAHDKDQAIDFRFEDGKLVSYQSIVFPDK